MIHHNSPAFPQWFGQSQDPAPDWTPPSSSGALTKWVWVKKKLGFRCISYRCSSPKIWRKTRGFTGIDPVPASWHGHAAFCGPKCWGTEELLNTSWHLATNVQPALVRNLHWQGLQHCGPCSLKKQKPSGRNCIILSGWFPCMAWGIRSISSIPNSKKSRVYIFPSDHWLENVRIFSKWGSWGSWQMSGRIGSSMPSKPWFRRSDAWLKETWDDLPVVPWPSATTDSLRKVLPEAWRSAAKKNQLPTSTNLGFWANLDRPAKGWEMTWSCRWS